MLLPRRRLALSLRQLSRNIHVLRQRPPTALPTQALPHRPAPARSCPASTPLLRLVRTTTTATARSPAQLSPNHDDPPPAAYAPPTTGILSHLPAAVVPYAELVRLDKPTGTLYLLLPCLWSTLLAGTLVGAPPAAVLTTSALFTTGALIMRGAGCTINDLWDRRIDPLVSRTRLRPIARGAISPAVGVLFTGGQLLAGLALLLQFPVAAVVAAIPSLLPVTVYPLMKRVTHYPQFFLGLSFSWGAILGFPALGLDLLQPAVAGAAAALYASNVAWTVLYDTVYAHQDIVDDRKAGVKSTAVRWSGNTKAVMAGLAAVQTGLLVSAGWVAGLGPVYYAWSCAGAALGNGWMIRRVDLENPQECGAWFKWCAWAVGGVAVGGGLLGEYVLSYGLNTRQGMDGKDEKGEKFVAA